MDDNDLKELHRMQLAAISSASLGYWKIGDTILPQYWTPALEDVARLCAKYEAQLVNPYDSEEIDVGGQPLNVACYAFIDAMPHALPANVFKDLRPALKQAIEAYLSNRGV